MGAFLNAMHEEGTRDDIIEWIKKLSTDKDRALLIDLEANPSRMTLMKELARLDSYRP